MKPLEPWQVASSHEIFSAPPWIHLSRQTVRLPDGHIVDDYHKIQLLDFSVIVAQTTNGDVLVERQYKHGLGQVALMLPAGALTIGEDALTAAKRELLEETGYASGDWSFLGKFTANANYGCGTMHLFAARSIRKTSPIDSDDLEEMEILFMPPSELFAAICAGKMPALTSVAAIALATHPEICRLQKISSSKACA
jgi:ADP-ribose pyrophosphatase